MERLDYWQVYSAQSAERWNTAGSAWAPETGERRTETGRLALIWGGRELSPEAYLAVPTFIRRGLRPSA
jgi:hypothetical protein